MEKRSSFGSSDTTYHSFHDIELFEPASPPRHAEPAPIKASRNTQTKHEQPVKERRTSNGMRMQRQDSGYESIASPRTSTSHFRPAAARRPSNASSNGPGSSSRPRTRPSIHRSAKTHPQYAARTSNQSLHLVRVNPPSQQFTYFQFPSPDAIELAEAAPEDPPAPPLPPQPTHYWTSDRTRRLEYAAIDAATRGVKGWVMRNLVPECFVPKENRHVSFDDDTGSVRRYRLDLEDDHEERMPSSDEGRRRKGWLSWGGRKNSI